MLVISRKTEEFVQIGENIIIKIIKSTNGSVKIGIDAPGNLRVLRGELQAEQLPLPKPLTKSRRHPLNDFSDPERYQTAEAV